MVVATDSQLRDANEGTARGGLITLSPVRFTVPIAPRNPNVTYVGAASVPSLEIRQSGTIVSGAQVRGTLTVEGTQDRPVTGVQVRDVIVEGGLLGENQMLWLVRHAERPFFHRVRSFATLTDAFECRGRCFYETRHALISECLTVLEQDGGPVGESHYGWLRDHSYDNKFADDVLLGGLNSDHDTARTLFLGASGSVPGSSPSNRFENCHYVTRGLVFVQDNVAGWSFEGCEFGDFLTNNLTACRFDRCTFGAFRCDDRSSTVTLQDCYAGHYASGSPLRIIGGKVGV